jgi:hypothetical protein
MNPEFWTTPAVVAAVVSGTVAVAALILNLPTNTLLHSRRLGKDSAMAERKAVADMALAERKFQLDVVLSDRKRRQELAEEVLSGFYQMRDIMRAIRFPFGNADEAKDRKRPDGESEQSGRLRDIYFAIAARFNSHRQAIAD